MTYSPDPGNLPDLYEQLEGILTEMAERPHYRVRNGKILRSRATGEPLIAKGPADEARRLLAVLKRDRGRLGIEPDSAPRPAAGTENS